MKTPKTDPGLVEIDRWHAWFIRAHEDVLRDDPDRAYHEQQRRQVRAIADAHVAEMRAAWVARTTR